MRVASESESPPPPLDISLSLSTGLSWLAKRTTALAVVVVEAGGWRPGGNGRRRAFRLGLGSAAKLLRHSKASSTIMSMAEGDGMLAVKSTLAAAATGAGVVEDDAAAGAGSSSSDMDWRRRRSLSSSSWCRLSIKLRRSAGALRGDARLLN